MGLQILLAGQLRQDGAATGGLATVGSWAASFRLYRGYRGCIGIMERKDGYVGVIYRDNGNHQAIVVRAGITVLIIRLASSQQEVDMASYLPCLLSLALGYDAFKRGDVVITAQRIYSGAKRVQGLLSFDFRIIGKRHKKVSLKSGSRSILQC